MSVTPFDRGDTGDRLTRIEGMIERHRLAKKRRRRRRAIVMWRKLEAQKRLVDLEKPLERVH